MTNTLVNRRILSLLLGSTESKYGSVVNGCDFGLAN